jgi:hypothetical protein
MWTCPKCGAKVDPSFEVCWQCGTTPDGVEDPTFVPADAVPPAESPLDLDMPPGDDPVPVPGDPVADELVECYHAANPTEAKFLADQLSEQGIPAYADTTDPLGDMGAIGSGPRVWVYLADLPRARAWLDEYDRHLRTEHGAPDRD